MFSTRSEYDRGVNTFSPEGRLFQVEYALGAIKLGSTAIGICVNDGVILASERRIASPLIEKDSVEKLLPIDDHIGCAMSGLMADARTLIDHARVECNHYKFIYNENINIKSCVELISELALDFSNLSDSKRKKIMSRPFGVALLIGGVDKNGPCLWYTEPSGTNTRFLAASIGSAQEGAELLLQENYNKNMSFEEAEILALTVLRQVMEDKLSSSNVEIAAIKKSDQMFYKYKPDDITKIIDSLPSPIYPTIDMTS
ncbi:proteasome subunit alpha type-5, putative [Plasmodium yoelii]|uniref:Proteasome subunit alpha type n=4 Tax=Plasmodium yoelii TaxID=5861 RepID=A0AAE9WJJ0_PLAYO|nr:proteasome subunit alpha type-5, putative [Plasmodium yoelii]EAA21516.1 proteasome subunit alpha type 5 [Plasmodium yoelii yoelii]WBY54790.1 proteasome subunit alpha type-5 [Plasmodium yoelii yoelii]CDU16143.1 proteasome subunit alpha type 5, putative [Plasmodium yoelii]VTZ71768.1 proteasome subunit alpha type-5, putative [Plasmodium yoelii]|eukprot:XP_729951.1 proteasome subunit alpha type-5, putative [Plasmodium yoelii]